MIGTAASVMVSCVSSDLYLSRKGVTWEITAAKLSPCTAKKADAHTRVHLSRVVTGGRADGAESSALCIEGILRGECYSCFADPPAHTVGDATPVSPADRK